MRSFCVFLGLQMCIILDWSLTIKGRRKKTLIGRKLIKGAKLNILLTSLMLLFPNDNTIGFLFRW